MPGIEKFLAANGLELKGKLSKGWTSEIFLAQDKTEKRFVLKVLREKSNRRDMARREAENLALANSVGVGPQFIKADFECDIVMMEYIDGPPFSEWLESGPSKGQLQKFIDALYSQARALDKLGLDHGQLAGQGRNILARDGMPVIIDFEKASTRRKCHNEKVIESFLFRSRKSGVVKKVAEFLGPQP